MTGKQALLQAAEILETNGWCRGMMSDPRGRLCALAALWRVGDKRASGEAQALLEKHMKYTITAWNDLRAANSNEVIRTLRYVAGLAA